MLVVVLLLPLSLAMDDGEFDNDGGGGGGGSGGPAAAAAAAVTAVDNNWRRKLPATRALTVAWRRAMTKADSRKHCNNQPTMAGGGGGGNGDSDGSGGGGGEW
jgi:hypothetical protein